MRLARYAGLAVAIVVVGGQGAAGAEDVVGMPQFDLVHYAKPAEYTALLPTMGTKSLIEKTAAAIRGSCAARSTTGRA